MSPTGAGGAPAGPRSGRGPASLRTQLVLGSVGVVAVAFVALGLLLAAFFGHYFAFGRLTALLVRARAVAVLARRPPAVANPRIATLVQDNGGHIWLVGEGGRALRQYGPGRYGAYSALVAPFEVQDVLAGNTLTRFVSVDVHGHALPQRLAVVAVPVFRVYGQPARSRHALIWAAPVGGAAVLRAVAARVAAVAGLGLLVAAALFAWLGSRLARPIRQQEEAARGIAAGRFDLAIPEAGPAEVRSLGRSLRGMARQLSELDTRRREFMADVSHELRSPLAALRGALEGIRGGTASRVERERYLGLALGETARLGRLVDDLLTLARSDARRLELRREPVDARETALRIALSLEPLADSRGVAFRFGGGGEDAALVDADPDRLSQVLWNLLDNAARHAPPGSEAEVDIRAVGRTVRIEVANGGPHIDEATMARLFERFEHGGGAPGSGTGLGLAIARTLTEAHGGSIAAEAPPQGGLRLIVLWPAARAAG